MGVFVCQYMQFFLMILSGIFNRQKKAISGKDIDNEAALLSDVVKQQKEQEKK